MGKIKADLIFDSNILPVYFDDYTKEDNVLSEFDTVALMETLNNKNNNDFTIAMVSIDLVLSRVSVFSEVFISNTQQYKIWNVADFTVPQQTIINNFIALL